MGRPTQYSEEYQNLAEQYLDVYKEDLGEVVPTAVGLCKHLGVARSTIYKWAADYPTFSDTLSQINEYQELGLINGSLSNVLNANISKLMLANHGYSDKTQQDNISSDGTMSPKEPVTIDDFYATDA